MKKAKLKVFYDGDCPLCNREIKHYQKLQGAENISWVDITSADIDFEAYSFDYQQAMQRLHVIDAENQLKTGAYGFVEIWYRLPAYRWLGQFLVKLHLVRFMDWFYSKFAKWRFQRRCKNNECYVSNSSRRNQELIR